YVQSMVDTSVKKGIELELINSENKYQSLVNSLPIGVFETDASGQCIYVNKEWQNQSGLDFNNAIGDGWKNALHQLDQTRIFNEWNNHVNESKPWDLEYRFVDIENNTRHILARAIVQHDEQGNVTGYLGTTIDISQKKHYEKQLETLHQVVEQAPISIMITSLTGDIEYVNAGFERTTGYNRREVIGKNPRFLKSGNTPLSTYRKIWKSLLSGKMLNVDIQNKKRNGQLYWENSNYSVVKNEAGVAYKYLSTKEDITQKIEDRKMLYQQANFDLLTGLPNRFRVLQRFDELLTSAKKNHERLSLLVIDIDDFKKINDTLGHLIGDQLLKFVANKLESNKTSADIVGRLGGDEFIIIHKGHNGNFDPDTIGTTVLSMFKKAIIIQGRTIALNLGIGIATFPDDGSEVSELLKSSDLALGAAKKLGRGKKIYFDQPMRENLERSFALEEELRNALSRNELFLVYQPQFDSFDLSISGIEALVRWNNPKFGMISPAEFIPIAEKTGLILEIGYFIFEEVIKARFRWQKTLKTSTRVAINLSPRQFDDGKLVQNILSILEKYAVPISAIELEITEGVFIDNNTLVKETLSTMHELGMKLSLDDFGTGYSSLSYLQRFPFDILKVDQSFVKDMQNSPVDKQLVEATIAMAHALELKVVAEGVEQNDQLEILKSLKCDYIQGYLLCKPLQYPEMCDFIRTHNAQFQLAQAVK
ncbi:MAG: EAL domain-containing protein, partial [Enterobacterales bacterium]|nr:EAL domain-containing protein [Enterobacterales bacterium]